MQPIASLRPGMQRGRARRDQERAPRGHAAARLQNLPRGRRRRERRHPLHLDEPGISRRHPQAASVGRHLRRREARFDGTSFHESGIRADVGRPRVGADGAHRAVLREDRRPSRRTCSGGSCARRSTSCRRRFPICCRPILRDAARADAAARGARGSALSAERSDGRRAERVPDARAAAADLRGVLSLSDRPCLAAPRDEHASSSRSCRRWTTASARRRRRFCRSS